MTDQFEFDPEDAPGEEPDLAGSEPAFSSDRLEESRDEGYLPPASWDEPVPADEELTAADHEFEQQQEQPEVVDDWDDGLRPAAPGGKGPAVE